MRFVLFSFLFVLFRFVWFFLYRHFVNFWQGDESSVVGFSFVQDLFLFRSVLAIGQHVRVAAGEGVGFAYPLLHHQR